MISKAKVLKGFAFDLAALNKRVFTFDPGLTTLFGPNGSGKTTLIKILAAYCGTAGGWSTFVEPIYCEKGAFGARERKRIPFPKRFLCLTPEKECEAQIEWDGSPTFYSDATSTDSKITDFGDPGDGVFGDGIEKWMAHRVASSGQMRIGAVMRIFNQILVKPPNLLAKKDVGNSAWEKALTEFQDYVRGLPRKGPMTVLLDEPDRSMGIPFQAQLWTEVLPVVATKFQVIVASHSPFALGVEKNTVIDLSKGGYVEECRKSLRKMKLG